MRMTCVATAVVLLLAGGATRGGDAGKDKEKLQGTWTLTQVKFKGEAVRVPADPKMQMIFTGDKVILKGGFKGNDEGTYKLDPAKAPRQITLTKKGGGADDTMNGIYEINGDTLKLAYSAKGPSGPRPTGFDAADVGIFLFKKAP